jgi:hypothetical protein
MHVKNFRDKQKLENDFDQPTKMGEKGKYCFQKWREKRNKPKRCVGKCG